MARRIHEPIEGPALDVSRARAWLDSARRGVRRANEDEAIFRASMKLSGQVLEIWKRGEETDRLPEAIEKARALLLAHDCGYTAEQADTYCEDPARVPSARLVGALLGLAVV